LFNKFNCEVEGDVLPIADNPCDVNGDGEVNIADINTVLAEILRVAASHRADGFDPDATYDVWGFLNVYKGEMELYPVRIVYHGSGFAPNPCDVNHDGEVNIADVNCIIDAILSL
jgi:hypothetical protein